MNYGPNEPYAPIEPYAVIATKSSEVFHSFDHAWKQCQIIFKHKCERTHPAWNEMNTLFNMNFQTVQDILQCLYGILQIRQKYPELMYRKNWMDAFNLCVNMIKILDKVN